MDKKFGLLIGERARTCTHTHTQIAILVGLKSTAQLLYYLKVWHFVCLQTHTLPCISVTFQFILQTEYNILFRTQFSSMIYSTSKLHSGHGKYFQCSEFVAVAVFILYFVLNFIQSRFACKKNIMSKATRKRIYSTMRNQSISRNGKNASKRWIEVCKYCYAWDLNTSSFTAPIFIYFLSCYRSELRSCSFRNSKIRLIRRDETAEIHLPDENCIQNDRSGSVSHTVELC